MQVVLRVLVLVFGVLIGGFGNVAAANEAVPEPVVSAVVIPAVSGVAPALSAGFSPQVRRIALQEGVGAGSGDIWKDQLARARALHRGGYITIAAGYAAIFAGVGMIFASPDTGVAITGIYVATGGSIAVVTGWVLATVGAFNANAAGRRGLGGPIPLAAGYAAVGCYIGAVVLAGGGQANVNPTLSTLGSVAGLAAYILPAVQMGVNKRHLRDAGLIAEYRPALELRLAPLTNGVAVVGTF